MSCSILWDDLWIAEKFQSNLEIAGSPRDIFRYSLLFLSHGVELLDGFGGRKALMTNQTPNTWWSTRESDLPV